MTPEDVRALALALPDVLEVDHHGRRAFRLTPGGQLATQWSDTELNVLLDDLTSPALLRSSGLRFAGSAIDAALVREIPFRNAAEAVTICIGARRRFRDQLGTANPAVMLGHEDAALALHRLGRVQEAVAFADEDIVQARAWGAPTWAARSRTTS